VQRLSDGAPQDARRANDRGSVGHVGQPRDVAKAMKGGHGRLDPQSRGLRTVFEKVDEARDVGGGRVVTLGDERRRLEDGLPEPVRRIGERLSHHLRRHIPALDGVQRHLERSAEVARGVAHALAIPGLHRPVERSDRSPRLLEGDLGAERRLRGHANRYAPDAERRRGVSSNREVGGDVGALGHQPVRGGHAVARVRSEEPRRRAVHGFGSLCRQRRVRRRVRRGRPRACGAQAREDD